MNATITRLALFLRLQAFSLFIYLLVYLCVQSRRLKENKTNKTKHDNEQYNTNWDTYTNANNLVSY